MRLILSTASHWNTDISDERGYIYYTISTPSLFNKPVTTITKYNWSGSSRVPETMGVIEWHRMKETVFRFNGKVTPANVMFSTRTWSTETFNASSGWYFLGPDQHTYKWKLQPYVPYCWMKRAVSNAELVRFYKKNLGIIKPLHPAHLELSTKVVRILDHIILIFFNVQSLRQARDQRERMPYARHSSSSPPFIIAMNAS